MEEMNRVRLPPERPRSSRGTNEPDPHAEHRERLMGKRRKQPGVFSPVGGPLASPRCVLGKKKLNFGFFFLLEKNERSVVVQRTFRLPAQAICIYVNDPVVLCSDNNHCRVPF